MKVRMKVRIFFLKGFFQKSFGISQKVLTFAVLKNGEHSSVG